jgi:rhodanese-related sulfurtransferase
MVTVFRPGSLCYRCLYPEMGGSVFSCSENGVLGPVPGIIGMLMTVEAIKLLTGAGELLSGYMLCYDGLAGSFRKAELRKKSPDCLCGKDFEPREQDYSSFCVPSSVPPPSVQARRDVSWAEFMSLAAQDYVLLDVRPQQQFDAFHLEGFFSIPLSELKKKDAKALPELQGKEVLVTCRRGNASRTACVLLEQQGLPCANLTGGLQRLLDDHGVRLTL